MFSTKKLSFFVLAVVFLLVFGCGCEEKSKPDSAISKKAPEMKLCFDKDMKGVYKVTTESSKSVDFEGDLPSKSSFKGGKTGSDVEVVFSSEVVDVDKDGNAAEKITIDSVKYLAVVKNNPVIDFDSGREKDKVSPLFGLIGKSYTVKVASNGEVLEVIDASEIRKAVAGGSSTHKSAQALVSDELIKQRHGSCVLPEDGKVAADTSWKKLQSFDFGLMGMQSYEKVYNVKNLDNSQVRVSMNALPSSEMAEDIHKGQQTSDFSKMFDNQETYNGNLVFDPCEGDIKLYSEKLDLSWMAVDPSAGKKQSNGAPAALKMSVVRGYSIEKIK